MINQLSSCIRSDGQSTWRCLFLYNFETEIEIKFGSDVLSLLNLLLQRKFWKVQQENVIWDRNFRIQYMNITMGTMSHDCFKFSPNLQNYKFALLKVSTTRKHTKPFSTKTIMFTIERPWAFV